MIEDPRKTGLKNGLRQLTIKELQRVITHKGPMVLDEYNYHEGKFCPLAIALELDKSIKFPTNDKIFNTLTGMGYTVYNTRGIEGEFYTTNRLEDLLLAAREVIAEKLQEAIKRGECPCLTSRDHCSVCEDGHHIFCNYYPHGNPEEAYRWFKANPEATKSIRPIGPAPEHERALQEITQEENANK